MFITFSCKNNGDIALGACCGDDKNLSGKLNNLGINFVDSFYLSQVEKIEIDSNNVLDFEGMSFIPGGKFRLGGDEAYSRDDELPSTEVVVSPFYMDKTEITNRPRVKQLFTS